MARDDDNEEDQAGEPHEPRECMACRGTGKVISNLGGSPSSVECPWCDGSGQRFPGRDAQARWHGQEAPEQPAATAPPEPTDGAA